MANLEFTQTLGSQHINFLSIQARPGDMAFSTSAQRPCWSYLPPPATAGVGLLATSGSPPVGGIAFPMGMFDKYKVHWDGLIKANKIKDNKILS